MKRYKVLLCVLLLSFVPITITLPSAQPASAWGLTTHMYIVDTAVNTITNSSWLEAFQYYLPELITGSTTPDQVWQDWENHLYYPETGEYNAPWAAAQWFEFARNNFTAGNWEEGFFAAGVLTHYFSDPCIPVHTDSYWPGHPGYEKDINENLGSLEIDDPTETIVENVTGLVIQNAEYSHQFYDTIVDHYDDEDSRALDDPEIKELTENCLYKAVDGVLSLFYTLTDSISAPDITITYDYVALIDHAHTNDYIDYQDEDQLSSIEQTLERNHYELRKQTTAVTTEDLSDVDLFIATCALDEYTSSELTAISNWASTGNKSMILTGRGDFSEYVDNAKPNQILEAIGSDIRINDDNVYMLGTYQLWYNDIYDIPEPQNTNDLTYGVSALTLFSPTSLYFIDENPILPIIYGEESAYQTDQNAPAPEVIYDDTDDGLYGEQIPLVAVEEIGDLRLLVAGTTFFSNYDYGKTAIFSNIQLLENFIDWSITNRSTENISNEDEVGPRIKDISWTPENPDGGNTVTIHAEITDPYGVNSVKLNYTTDSTSVELDMSATGDEYSVEIPDVTSGNLTFSIIATDANANTAIRAYFDISWGAGTGTTDTVPPPNQTMLIFIGVGIAVVAVVIVVVILLKRR